MTLKEKGFEKHCGRRKLMIIIFPQCFLLYQGQVSLYELHVHLIMSSANAFNLAQSKKVLSNCKLSINNENGDAQSAQGKCSPTILIRMFLVLFCRLFDI